MNTPDISLPAAIWTKPRLSPLRRGWRLGRIANLCRILQAEGQPDCLRMLLVAWADRDNLACPVPKLDTYFARLMECGAGTWESDGTHGTWSWAEDMRPQPLLVEAPAGFSTGPSPRPRYPSDDLQTRRDRSATTPQRLRNDSATTPREPAVYRNPEPVTGKTDSGLAYMQESGIRNPVPVSVAERLTDLGMERKKADGRLKEFGERRCLDALTALGYELARGKEIASPAGYVADFLLKKREMPAGYWEWHSHQQSQRPSPAPSPPAPLPKTGESNEIQEDDPAERERARAALAHLPHLSDDAPEPIPPPQPPYTGAKGAGEKGRRGEGTGALNEEERRAALRRQAVAFYEGNE